MVPRYYLAASALVALRAEAAKVRAELAARREARALAARVFDQPISTTEAS